MTVTSALVRDEVLAPAMTSLAHNLDQFNDTPEVDSGLERILEAATAGDLDRVRRETLEGIASNLLEGQATGKVAGFGDRLAVQLHRIETATGGTGLSTKAICRRLRDPLKVVRDPAAFTVAEVTEAHLTVKETVRSVPATELLKGSVRRELGTKLTTVLEGYVAGVQA